MYQKHEMDAIHYEENIFVVASDGIGWLPDGGDDDDYPLWWWR